MSGLYGLGGGRGARYHHVLKGYVASREVAHGQHVLDRNTPFGHLADAAAGHLQVCGQGGRPPAPARDPCLKFRHRHKV